MWKLGECRAAGLFPPKESSESEILSASEESCEFGEDEACPPSLDEAYDELEHYKQHLLTLRAKYLYTAPVLCAAKTDSEVSTESLFQTEDQLHMKALRKCNCALVEKMKELVKDLLKMRKDVEEADRQCCRLAYQNKKMLQQLEIFKKFMTTAHEQFGLCIERNEHLKATKVGEVDYRNVMSYHFNKIEVLTKSGVQQNCIETTYNKVQQEFKRMRTFMRHLLEHLQHQDTFFREHMHKAPFVHADTSMPIQFDNRSTWPKCSQDFNTMHD